LNTGIEKIFQKVSALRTYFVKEVQKIEGIRLYGASYKSEYSGVVGLNIEGKPSSEVSLALFDRYGIATRSGAHCAPLLHKYFDTQELGMVRFSFSSFNTKAELKQAIEALKEIISFK